MQHCTHPGSLLNAHMRAQLCLAFCNPVDCSMPGSSVHRIFQARILEWVAISSPEFQREEGAKILKRKLSIFLY